MVVLPLAGFMTQTQRAKALRDFQNDPPTTVFLLSVRAGAVGINLTQANHVFLMEPLLNPAFEAQAVGRVHRMVRGKKSPKRAPKCHLTLFALNDLGPDAGSSSCQTCDERIDRGTHDQAHQQPE